MRNEGRIDRVIRVALGVGLLGAAWFLLGLRDGALYGIIAAAVSVVLIATGLVGFCPAYRLMGIRTCRLAAPPSRT